MVDKKSVNFSVSPCCTLLFSQKESIMSFKVIWIAVHYNCLIGWIMIAWGYRPGNAANTTTDICLLIENNNKNTENWKAFFKLFFISHLAAPRPTLGQWQGGSHTHLMLITTLFQVLPEGHREPLNNIGPQSLAQCVSVTRAGNLLILNVTY